MIILHSVLFIALCDSWFSWISFVQSAFGGDTSDPLKAHSQNCISHCLCFSIHNWLFGILQNFYFTSLNFLFEFVQNLIESWLSKSDISLMTILEFGLCLCHFIITLFDLLTFLSFGKSAETASLNAIGWQKKLYCVMFLVISDCKYVIIHDLSLSLLGGDSTQSPSLGYSHNLNIISSIKAKHQSINLSS